MVSRAITPSKACMLLQKVKHVPGRSAPHDEVMIHAEQSLLGRTANKHSGQTTEAMKSKDFTFMDMKSTEARAKCPPGKAFLAPPRIPVCSLHPTENRREPEQSMLDPGVLVQHNVPGSQPRRWLNQSTHGYSRITGQASEEVAGSGIGLGLEIHAANPWAKRRLWRHLIHTRGRTAKSSHTR